MSESLLINPSSTKEETYNELFPQLKALLFGEDDLIANLANVSAALKEAFEAWLAPQNFDQEGEQKERLGNLTALVRVSSDPTL